ncbi:unnamed protein product, partial [Ectocarpus sp. 12 AP-2014]
EEDEGGVEAEGWLESDEEVVAAQGEESGAEDSLESEESEGGDGMSEWLKTQAREAGAAVGAPPRKTLDQILEEGLSESDEDEDDEKEATLAERLQEHQDLGRRWVSGATDVVGSQRTKKQLLKIAMLGYARSVIAGG